MYHVFERQKLGARENLRNDAISSQSVPSSTVCGRHCAPATCCWSLVVLDTLWARDWKWCRCDPPFAVSGWLYNWPKRFRIQVWDRKVNNNQKNYLSIPRLQGHISQYKTFWDLICCYQLIISDKQNLTAIKFLFHVIDLSHRATDPEHALCF